MQDFTDSQEDRSLHNLVCPLVTSGKNYHFPMETGLHHWAVCTLLQRGPRPAAKLGRLRCACQGPRVQCQDRLVGVKPDPCTAVWEPGWAGAQGR